MQINGYCAAHVQVSCGQYFTLAISKDGSQVFACGKADAGAFGNSSISGEYHQPLVSTHTVHFNILVRTVYIV